MVKFSVTIPAYKGAFLSEAIESVLSQTYSNFELIIVDDHSPENLMSIVDNYPDQRIKYYRNETNCGAINVVDNWNICLSYCTGDFVICMGDDDRLLPCCLEEYSKLIQKYPEIIVFHAWTQIIDENSKLIKKLQPRPELESFFELTYQLWSGRLQYIGDFCYNISHLREVGGYYKLPLAWGSDDITAARASLKNGIANTQIPCFEYRFNSLTISNSSDNIEIKLKAILGEMEWYNTTYNKINSEILSEVELWYYDSLQLIKDKNRQDRMINEIIISINSNIFTFFRWMRLCPSYNIRRIYLLKYLIKKYIL